MSRFTLVIFLIAALRLKGQTVTALQKPPQPINDFVVSLHEETINKVLLAVGDISGTNDYEVMLIHGKYHWTIRNPQISIRPDSSHFYCDAFVNVGPFNYRTTVVGEVKISYDNDKNLIYVRISRAIFELYTIVFGKKFHIKNIHLEDYFREPFAFEGPRSFATDMEFTMPDSTLRKVYMQPADCRMELKWKEICTACEVAVSNKPFKPAVRLSPPIEAARTPSAPPAASSTLQPPAPRKK